VPFPAAKGDQSALFQRQMVLGWRGDRIA